MSKSPNRLDEGIACPECGGRTIRHTPANADGRHHICDTCRHMWHEPRRSASERRPVSASARRAALPRWTMGQAYEHFLRMYPSGFADPEYSRRERTWKWEKHRLWIDTLEPAGLPALARTSPATVSHLFEKMVQTRLPMLSPMGEIVVMRDAVHRPELAVDYFLALAEYLDAATPGGVLFDRYVNAFTSIPLFGEGQLEKWTLVTFIPFFAQPSRHMFLKPERTKEITRRFGKDILYSPTPKWDTYERLLAFSNELLDFLRPHGATDMIDVQSFIWAVTGSSA